MAFKKKDGDKKDEKGKDGKKVPFWMKFKKGKKGKSAGDKKAGKKMGTK